jgi:para-nitrobenzyl esterase
VFMSVEAEWVNRCVADVAQSQLRGIYEDGVRTFRGVPYAASPVGDQRFKPPAPAPSLPMPAVVDALEAAA